MELHEVGGRATEGESMRLKDKVAIIIGAGQSEGSTNVMEVAQASRGRWKVANENNNVLKTRGYHLEHNFGHGKRYLAAFMLSLNSLAFLFHTVLPWCDGKYALLRQVLV